MALTQSKRVLVIGLDCAAPRFVFGPEGFDLPNLRRLMASGCWGRLRSCDPPITVPAWSCMMSGKDPGTLGIYGFRNRRDRSYDPMAIATGADVREPRVWDILSEAGKKVVLIGVPQTFPVQPVNGCLVSGLLTPDTSSTFTFPAELGRELLDAVGDYIIDVPEFRTDDKEGLLERIHALMNNRFDVASYLMGAKAWDFFMLVEMGVDRLHHAFWSHADASHPKHESGGPYAEVVREYYQELDGRIGELCAQAGDDTAVLVVSDHGAKAIHGGVCVNQWLIEEGYLVLEEPPSAPVPLEECRIDWGRTRAWGSGGYYARIHLNVRGREPLGVVDALEIEALRTEIAGKIEAMAGPNGKCLGNRALKPEEIYATVTGVAPDLIVYYGDLHWRSIGLVGCDSVFAAENDTGPDEANHDFDGIFIMEDGADRRGKCLNDLNLLDVAPTILRLMGVKIPADIQGRSIV
ncbi:MAG: alkaline phosphatase family protein [Candidatus Hydrogenedentes bacterium]|nr:alkaline phosphatase family protein [Candidatus Hydrogenedentota bacterium]